MAVSYCDIVGTYKLFDGTTGASGTITVRPRARVRNTLNDDLLMPDQFQVTLDANGLMPTTTPNRITVVASDSASVSPEGVTYRVTENIEGVGKRSYNIAVPAASPLVGGRPTLDLGTVSPLDDIPELVFPTESVAAHEGDTSGAHAASAVSFTPAGTIAATNVQAAIEEAASEGGGGPPTGGAGGVLSGSYPNPGFAVDMAEQSELDAHTADTTSVHGITNTANLATTAAVTTAISNAIAALVDTAPGTLDTLAELAAALGDDPDFAATLATEIAQIESELGAKVDKATLDANSVLVADADNTPVARVMAASTILARLATGNIVPATPAQLKTLLAIASGDVSGLGALATLSAVGSAQITDGSITDTDVNAANKDGAAGTASMRTLGTGAAQAAAGNHAHAGGSFTPADLGAALVGWWKPESLGANGSSISSWADSSGLGHDLVQADGAKQPTVVTNALNGYKCARFDGTDDWLKAAYSASDPEMVFTLYKIRAATNNACDIDGSNAGGGTRALREGVSANPSFILAFGNEGLAMVAGGTSLFRLYTMTVNAATPRSTLRLDDDVARGGPASIGAYNAPGGITLGANGFGTGHSQTDHVETIHVNGLLSPENRRKVMDYFGAKYLLW